MMNKNYIKTQRILAVENPSQNRDKLKQIQKIEIASTEWNYKNRSKNYLLQGKQLKDAQEFKKEQDINFALSDLADEFIRQSRFNRRNNRLKLISFGFIGFVLTIFFAYTLQRQMQTRRNSENIKIEQQHENASSSISVSQELNHLVTFIDNKNLNGKNIEATKFVNFFLANTKLKTAKIKSINLEGAYFPNANLQGFNLKYANIFGAYLVGANLQNTNLESTNLIGTNLQNANLKGANFRNAEFGCIQDSHVRNLCTDFRRAKNLTPEQIKQAKNWQSAHYSPEFRVKLGLPPEKKN